MFFLEPRDDISRQRVGVFGSHEMISRGSGGNSLAQTLLEYNSSNYDFRENIILPNASNHAFEGINLQKQTNSTFGVQIAPNPNNGMFYVAYDLPNIDRELRLNIHDLTGKLIFTKRLEENSTIMSLDMSEVNSGIYLVKINAGDLLIDEEKIVIQN